MAPEDILAEISMLRDTVNQATRRIHDLSRILHDRMRRVDPDEADRGVYLTYSNAWARFAGMVQQGLQRTRQADRLLRLLADRDEAPTPDVTYPEPVNLPDRAQSVPQPSALDDLIAVYGEEMTRDAADGQRQR
jgi:hypothetical protein